MGIETGAMPRRFLSAVWLDSFFWRLPGGGPPSPAFLDAERLIDTNGVQLRR
jgi:hypothetical protein